MVGNKSSNSKNDLDVATIKIHETIQKLDQTLPDTLFVTM